MNLPTAVRTCFSKYVTFSGRASRPEYWWFVLFTLICFVVLSVIETRFLGYGTVSRGEGSWAWQSNGGPLSGLFALGIFLPTLAVAVRRLHDSGKSGWWLLIQLVPLIGALVLLYHFVQPSQVGPNRFGAAPRRTPPSLL
ncbi:DUF805 domain-containing protein [Rhodobacter capsulatus]|uniref:DUF805 domain-containing protein n=1 Tax=Rhodobacter capsulatus TaxID=1061 RepID=A0A4U1JPT1_RHOCA|nr:DUF805 domain-containing protein [Rhodobacter capsulatus]TKD18060.1 DUF805 domain-containing protein [Rhodobacter capsulatus]